MNSLSAVEKKIYEYIKKTVSEKGYSPSVRDIAAELSLKSTSTVHYHLTKLEEAGYIFKENGKSRTVRIDEEISSRANLVPILGDIKNGSPLSADENFDGYVSFAVPKDAKKEDLFAVRIKGNTMQDLGILNGDVLIINKSSTAKEGNTFAVTFKGEVLIVSQLTESDPTQALLGKVIALLRSY